jgi:general secretion pathway protein A
MYNSYYGFSEKPFNLLPDSNFFYLSQSQQNSYTHLKYSILENKGFVVITGNIGCGKTTLINYLLSKIQPDLKVGLINNPRLTPVQFIKMICREFELGVSNNNKAESLGLISDFLLDQFKEGKRVVLIVDEAQNMFPKTMEEIRMLSNLEAEKHHLIQIILVGQPELKMKLQREDLKQFTQRISVYCHLNRLNDHEVAPYIQHRLEVGGAKNLEIFNKQAVEAITQYSNGIPRIINLMCDTALLIGFSDEIQVIDRNIIEEVMKIKKDEGIFSCITENTHEMSLHTSDIENNFSPMSQELCVISNIVQRIEILLTKIDHNLDKLINK